MHRFRLHILAAMLALAFAIAASVPAAAENKKSNSDITRTELRNFDRYLDSHPQVAKELEQNPRLVDDPKYMAAHPGLKAWLDHHPNSREELRENPKAFMARERAFERHENRKAKKDKDGDRDGMARMTRRHRR